MRKILFLFILTISIVAVQGQEKHLTDTASYSEYSSGFTDVKGTFVLDADHYKTRKFDVAIFPANYIDLIPEKRFTPTRQEVEKAELELRNQLEKLNQRRSNQSSSPIIHKNLNKYRRQYFGYIDNNGQKILLINCIWKKDSNDTKNKWLKERIIVLDGGSYYWQVKYNVDTGELFDLVVNGYA